MVKNLVHKKTLIQVFKLLWARGSHCVYDIGNINLILHYISIKSDLQIAFRSSMFLYSIYLSRIEGGLFKSLTTTVFLFTSPYISEGYIWSNSYFFSTKWFICLCCMLYFISIKLNILVWFNDSSLLFCVSGFHPPSFFYIDCMFLIFPLSTLEGINFVLK